MILPGGILYSSVNVFMGIFCTENGAIGIDRCFDLLAASFHGQGDVCHDVLGEVLAQFADLGFYGVFQVVTCIEILAGKNNLHFATPYSGDRDAYRRGAAGPSAITTQARQKILQILLLYCSAKLP